MASISTTPPTNRALRGLALAAALSACGDPPPQAPEGPCADLETADACWLARASQAPPGEDLDAICEQIGAEPYLSHCWFAASRAQGDLDDIGARCDRIEDPLWRSECYLAMLDGPGRALDPVSWLETCRDDAPRLTGPCVSHGTDRWLEPFIQRSGASWFRRDALDAQAAAMLAAAPGDNRSRLSGFAGSLFALDAQLGGDGDRAARCAALTDDARCLSGFKDRGGVLIETTIDAWPAEREERWW